MSVTTGVGRRTQSLPHFFLEKIIFWLSSLFVLFFILPATLLYDRLTYLRNAFILAIQSAPKAHNRKVAVLQKQIREWNDGGRKKRLCNARPAWQMMGYRLANYKNQMLRIHTDYLVDILEVDEENRTVQVEPSVTIGQLLDCLLPLGFTIPLVPAFDDLTIGGLINGCGIASSSRKYGLFQHICISYDVLMPDGSVITTSKRSSQSSENQALFYGVPWSHGTLGFVVSATIRIIPCKPFVRLTYLPCNSVEAAGDILREEAVRRENEFVDAILFSREMGVVMKGAFDDGPARNQKSNPIGKWYKPWFFKYVKQIGDSGNVVTEYVPIRDYYRRHSRSIFWGIQDALPFGNDFIFRYALGWASPPKVSLLKLVAAIGPLRKLLDRSYVFQDLLVPAVNLDEALHIVHGEMEVYPLWLCPVNLPSTPGIIRQRTGRNIIYVDIGVYGESEKSEFKPKEAVQRIDRFLRAVAGVQMLYADTYMDRSEFWEMFDSSLYEWLRVKYGCRGALPDVYEKTFRPARY
ncbi:Diminuto-like protein [Toxocara canis]|uniref:Delta(24)-sterol reductase n=1 Tax=Toxocara canis TaxID=6265 RepID=A0A0B2VH51_TOXCA|nr:Diminuto-like protein [Toxocara canis]